jgi:hypothetical protein
LCSLDELGWTVGGPDEVAVLLGLDPGDCLHSVEADRRLSVVDRPEYLMVADVGPLTQRSSVETQPEPEPSTRSVWRRLRVSTLRARRQRVTK